MVVAMPLERKKAGGGRKTKKPRLGRGSGFFRAGPHEYLSDQKKPIGLNYLINKDHSPCPPNRSSPLVNREPVLLSTTPAHRFRPGSSVPTQGRCPVCPRSFRPKRCVVAEKLTANGSYFVNPIDALIERDQKERTYYLVDIHFTVAGNQTTAEVAIPVVQQAATQ